MHEEQKKRQLDELIVEARALSSGVEDEKISTFINKVIATISAVIEDKIAERHVLKEGELYSYLPLFREVGIFAALTDESLVKVIRSMSEEEFKKDEKIIAKGDIGDSLYIVLEGEAAALVEGDGKLEHIIMSPGDVFGEMALLTGLPRTVDVIAYSDCILGRLNKKPFAQLCKTNPQAADLLTKLLAERLGQSASRMLKQKIGNYEIIKTIGQGGMGVVYQGKNEKLNRVVALKMLPHKMVFEQEFVDIFLSEARLVAGLNHSNIVRLYEIANEYATYFMVLEYIDGKSLGDILEEKGKLDVSQVTDIIEKIGSALTLSASHEIVHKDIKPDNIMISDTGEIKLLDFGIAVSKKKSVEDDDDVGRVSGTIGYMSPEQGQGKVLNSNSDIYSFGVVCYELLTGKVPFHGKALFTIVMQQISKQVPRVSQINKDIPKWLDDFVFYAMQPFPAKRLQSFKGTLEIIRRVKAGTLPQNCKIPFEKGDFDLTHITVNNNAIDPAGGKGFLQSQTGFNREQLLACLFLMAVTATITFFLIKFLG
ncbi:protein kinase [Candidatus Riflebacteria bacterium]